MNRQAYAACAAFMVLAAPASADPVYHNWSGYYAGAHAGYGWGDARIKTDPESDEFEDTSIENGFSIDLDGAVVGGQIGYNFQNGEWLFGIEADGSWTGADGKIGGPLEPPFTAFFFNADAEIEWLASIRGRIGVIKGNWLFFGTGGVAFGGTELRGETNFAGYGFGISDSESETRVGWVAGGGFEKMLSERCIVRIEYLHYDLGSERFFFDFDPLDPAPDPYTYFGRSTFDLDVVRAAVVWRFAKGAPQPLK